LTACCCPESSDLAQAIYDYRLETNDRVFIRDLSKPDWYKNVPGAGAFKSAPIW
jgi:hypothetical protein